MKLLVKLATPILRHGGAIGRRHWAAPGLVPVPVPVPVRPVYDMYL